jgi:hypothetical protein
MKYNSENYGTNAIVILKLKCNRLRMYCYIIAYHLGTLRTHAKMVRLMRRVGPNVPQTFPLSLHSRGVPGSPYLDMQTTFVIYGSGGKFCVENKCINISG